MAIKANIGALPTGFVASLSNGHSIEASHLCELAKSIAHLGVAAGNVQYHWRAGQRMLTAGQQSAFAAEMHCLVRPPSSPSALALDQHLPVEQQLSLMK